MAREQAFDSARINGHSLIGGDLQSCSSLIFQPAS
jgi:hypothetical protein